MTGISAALGLLVAASFPQAGPRMTPADSLAALRAVRAEQERFERVRRDNLSWSEGGAPDHCDEIVAFHCFTYGDPEDAWEPPEESHEVKTARDSLLARLARAAGLWPGDRWIAGQRVRYLVEAGRAHDARAAAANCRPEEGWWCLALTGYAAHAAEDYVAAEMAYDRALAAMTPDQRCKWSDISRLMPSAPANMYRQLGCKTREPVERRFWWLADPLYLTPGNERRSEHYSRMVHIQFEEDGPSVSGSSWVSSFSVWTIRYGWPAGWERERSSSLMASPEPQIITRYRGPSQVFEPGWKSLDRLESLTPDALPLRPEGAKTGYVPTYAERFDTLRNQVAVFRRGDSAVVLAAYDLSSDSLPADRPVEAGLFLWADERDTPRATRAEQSAEGFLSLAAPPRSGLVSVEVKSRDGRRAGRTRSWLPLAPLDLGSIAVSDILLLSRSDSLPRTFGEAAPLARKTTSALSAPLGLYWEIYGLGTGSAPVSISLTLVKEGKSWLSRAARSLGMGGDARPAVSLTWNDLSRADGDPTSGAIALDLVRNDPGRYTLHLEVSSPGRGTARARREITIGRPRS